MDIGDDMGVSKRHMEVDFSQNDLWELSRLGDWPLYPFCVEEVIRHVPTWFREERSCFMMLVFLLSGRMNYRCAGATYGLVPGKLLVLPLGVAYAFESETTGGAYHKMVLELKGVHVASVAETLGLNQVKLLDYPDGAGLAERLRALGALVRGQREEDIPALMGKTYELLNELSLLGRERSKDSRLLATAQARLESRLEEPLSTPRLAAELGISVPTLNRLFRDGLETSPQKFRTARRMAHALELLENSSYSVKEVAGRVGYCNQFYFANEFRRQVGRSPSSCRRT